uniref:Large neutral amino acids transporter small subunit 4-like n=1 Tax=Saccoglossus kowalevskii TaxID=10224 RepID=A0ABM0M300_SACKO|nr:PREDICTED: large neutral amino acids transporter small subunit 4-like [Saccoglossus kowalevskii]
MPPELFAFQGKKQRSAYKKVLIITLAVLEGFFTTLPYGWASLVVVLKADGFYSDLCHADSSDCQQITWNTSAHETDSMTTLAVRFNETAPVAIATTYDTVGVYGEYCTCSAQDERLNLVFTIAMSLTLSMCFPTGAVYDLLGPRKTRLICWYV